MYAQTQTFLPRDHGRSIVQFPSYLSSRSLYINSALGGKPRALAHMLDSLVRVSRRVDKRHFVKGPTTARRQNWPIQVQKPIPRHHGSSTKRKKHKYLLLHKTLPPIGSFSAISGTLSLSFQSSLHLSLTVLVRYRSPTYI